ncbi:SUPPRESSOR OF ABI3-5-like isoform X2 [Rutidosis leptorrhynchoides]|uniref:SUPPRESSOR OF ABI3-5-like isoform X2 n=1 Tax=Rutidosis leptorrhynchoides TaxID=125765 RepID=UPI003A9967F2
MDPNRYGLQHEWENNSAPDRYGEIHEHNFREGDPYDDRRYYPVHRDSRRHVDSYHEMDMPRESLKYREVDYYDDYGYERPHRYSGRNRDDYTYDDYDYSRERDYEYGRHSYDFDYDRGGRREGSLRSRGSRDRECERKGLSRERDQSPYKRYDRSRSRGHGKRVRSRSPRSCSLGRSYREDSYDDDRYDRSERRRDRDEKRHHGVYWTAPSATVVVKGLSQKTTEEDLHQILAEWGPLRHVRLIKERSSGVSRGFAFIDFPTMGSARSMMDTVGDEGLVVDGRKLFFEYSKPTGLPFGSDGSSRSGHMKYRSTTLVSDWLCTICSCVNFARRTLCFQCNEPRTDDAPLADMASSNTKKGETGPTHVLAVRGLDENADEEMLRYEFSKHAAIKDLRLVRDKFTHVSRGFAFVHFHSVADATKALKATNGTTLDKNGQILRVAYAKGILGPATGASSSHSSSLAAAAIEAAAFSQQYDGVGWAPKEYNPDDKQSNGKQDQSRDPTDATAPQSGFVWDEASGYYYDATSGFYYDGNTGLYYDGNNGIWYSYDQQSQQYMPCNDQNNKTSENEKQPVKASNSRKVVISAPAATITSTDKTTSLPDAVQAAAAAAVAAEKLEKEKIKEIRLASKSSILANKKKMSNVLSMWKQRSHESQSQTRNQPSVAVEEKPKPVAPSTKGKLVKDNLAPVSLNTSASLDAHDNTRPAALRGVIRGSTYVGPSTNVSTSSPTVTEQHNSAMPFRTDASALGSYTPPAPAVGGKRRFSELPVQSSSSVKEQTHTTTYRDRAAERRSLYGPSSFGDDLYDLGVGDDGDSGLKRGVMESMPFPPGVGGRGGEEGGNSGAQSYEVITGEKAIDESNVGNRMLRNMGWQEGIMGVGWWSRCRHKQVKREQDLAVNRTRSWILA